MWTTKPVSLPATRPPAGSGLMVMASDRGVAYPPPAWILVRRAAAPERPMQSGALGSAMAL